MKLGGNTSVLALILVLSSVVMISLAFQKKNVEGIDPILLTTDPDIVKTLDAMIAANTSSKFKTGQPYRNNELKKIRDNVGNSTGYTTLVALYNNVKLSKNDDVIQMATKLKQIMMGEKLTGQALPPHLMGQ